VLPARYRMTRSADFGVTVRQGVRAAQPDLVVYALRVGAESGHDDGGSDEGPRIGLVVGKSVGTAVQRHRVSRRLRHVMYAVLADLDSADRLVIRALPSSRNAISARLESQLRAALKRVRAKDGAGR
jgi:ribonuclease P protein component